jgi:trehalose 6-phosphate synthase/phosphatase
MPLEEQTRRNEPMRSRLEEYDTTRWGNSFLDRLDKARDARKELVFRVLDSTIRDDLLENWRNSRRKLIILDYDGCLVPFNRNLQAALPDRGLIDVSRSRSKSTKHMTKRCHSSC